MAYSYHKRALAEGIKGGLSRLELSKMYLWLVREEIQRETRGNVMAAHPSEDRSQELERGDLVAAEMWLAEVGAVQEVKEVSSAVFARWIRVLVLIHCPPFVGGQAFDEGS